MSESDYRGTIRHVRDAADVELKVGVGWARTPQQAGMGAKHALEECRDNGSVVELAGRRG